MLSESYPTTILEQKAKKLRKETGNQSLRSLLHSGLTPFNLFKRSIIRPAKMLFFSPIVLLLSIDMAVVYGYLYLLFTTITEVFQSRYHFSQGSVGLTYLGLGIGMFLGLAIFGAASDYILKRQSAKGEMKPEYRLPPMIPGAFFIPIGLFIYGWTAEKQVFWFVPIFGSSLVGLGLLATFVSLFPVSSHCSRPERSSVANSNVPRGRLHHPCRIRPGSQYRAPFPGWRFATPSWPNHVREARLRVGELTSRLHRRGYAAYTVVLPDVRRADTDESKVSSHFLGIVLFMQGSDSFVVERFNLRSECLSSIIPGYRRFSASISLSRERGTTR